LVWWVSEINTLEVFALGEEVLSTYSVGLVRGASPATSPPYEGTANILRDPVEDNPSITEPIRSSMAGTSDLNSFSVVSGVDSVLQFTRVLEASAEVSDPPTSPSDRLTSLAQRYHDLCHTIGTLRDSINKQAKGIKAKAQENFEHAKLRLETSRGKAREIVENTKKSTPSAVYIRLPWTLTEDG
jgi:hypothetical protein